MTYSQDLDTSQFKLKDSASAILSAIQYAGLDKSEGFMIENNIAGVELITLVDTTIPILHDKFNGRTVWLVVMDSIFLNLKKELSHIVVKPRTFEIYIDAETGQFLKLQAYLSGAEYKNLNPYFREEMETHLANQREEYINLCDSIPKLSFYDAANISTYANPHGAKEIHAILIKYSIRNSEPVSAWVITLFGTPPYPMDSDVRNGITENLSRRNRVVIHANTGDILLSSRRLMRIESD